MSDEQESTPTEEKVAIVGVGFRLPGCNVDSIDSLEDLKQILSDLKDCISKVPINRWDVENFYDSDPDAIGKTRSTEGSFIKDCDKFDFFSCGISAKSAARMDPQHRLILEVTHQALRSAGIPPEHISRDAGKNTSVYVGQFNHDNEFSTLSNLENIDAYTAQGNCTCMAANQVSSTLNLSGESFTVDSACSSSSIAINLGVNSILSGESDYALVGGTNLNLNPEVFIAESKARMLSPTNRCHTFDEDADGYVRGEGACMILLKPLSKAISEDDHIFAVIEGTASNQNGLMVGGITTPSSNAQTELLKKLLNKTETHPNQIGFVEAHGTGTQLGDRAEITAIANAIGIHRTNNIPLKIGSVKGHIGHLEAAAGIIGLLKMIVMMRYEIFLPQANLNNPIIKKDERNIEIQRQVQKWESCADIPRIGIINCFGFGGTNFAMIVSQYRNNKQNHVTNLTAASSCYFLPIAAKSEKVLAKEIDIHIKYLSKNCTSCDDDSTLRNLCYTNAHRRFHHSVRIAVVGRSAAELIKNLKIAKFNIISSFNIQPEIVFVFPGMGCHYANMGIQLMNCSSIFGKILKEFNDEFCKLTNNKIRLIDGLQRDPIDSSLSAYAIPSIEIALSIFLEQIGILPSVVVGHSAGEIAAAFSCGMINMDGAIKIIHYRAQLQSRCINKGSMLAASISVHDAQKVIEEENVQTSVWIAADNSSTAVTFTGTNEGLEKIKINLQSKKSIQIYLLSDINIPYHSPIMGEINNDLIESLKSVNYYPSKSNISMISTVTGKKIKSINSEYWALNNTGRVNFTNAINQLDQSTILLEVGPQPIMKSYLSHRIHVSTLNKKNNDDLLSIYRALAQLFILGVKIPIISLTGKVVIDLPYPFVKELLNIRFSVENHQNKLTEKKTSLLGKSIFSTNISEVCWVNSFVHTSYLPTFQDHKIELLGGITFPGCAYVIMGFLSISGDLILNDTEVSFRDIYFMDSLLVPSDSNAVPCTMMIRRSLDGYINISVNESNNVIEKCKMSVHVLNSLSAPSVLMMTNNNIFQQLWDSITNKIKMPIDFEEYSSANFYTALETVVGIQYGPLFRKVKRGIRSGSCFISLVTLENKDQSCSTELLDSFLHSFFGVMRLKDIKTESTYLPGKIKEIRFTGSRKIQGEYAICFAELTSKDNITGKMEGNVFVYSQMGHELLQMTGIQLVELQMAPQNFSLYHYSWPKKEIIDTSIDIIQDSSSTFNAALIIPNIDPNRFGPVIDELNLRNSFAELRLIKVSYDDINENFSDIISNVATVNLFIFCINDHYLKHLSYKDQQKNSYGVLLSLAKHLKESSTVTTLVVLTSDAYFRGNNATNSSIIGLSNVIRNECTNILVRVIDLPSNPSEIDFLCLDNEFKTIRQRTGDIAIRDGHVYSHLLKRLKLNISKPIEINALSKFSILCTGGTSGIGLQTAQFAIQKYGCRNVILICRSVVEKNHPCRKLFLDLGVTNLEIFSGTVEDYDFLRNVVAELSSRNFPPIGAIFHAAGVTDDGSIENQSFEKFEEISMPAKVIGTENIFSIIKDFFLPITILVLFSSVATVFGIPGTANYSAACAYMDGVAQRERSMNKEMLILSINIGPISDVGMAIKHTSEFERQGYIPMKSENFLNLLSLVLNHANYDNSCVQVAIVEIKWSVWLGYYVSEKTSTFSNFAGQQIENCLKDKLDNVIREIHDDKARVDNVRKIFLEEASMILEADVSDFRNFDRSLSHLGFDSHTVHLLRKNLEQANCAPSNLLSINVGELVDQIIIKLSKCQRADCSLSDTRRVYLNECEVEMDGECKRISDNVSLNGDKCAADEVLVTGANGYVGRNLMWNLLESNKKVVALVRGNENKSGVDRLFESLPSSYKEKFTQCLNSQQLKVYEGDTSKSFLNLPDETYHRICSSVIIILHCAAKVNHQYNYDELKDDNVKSVWNIATFALTGQLKSIHHISTDGILMILEGVKDDNIQASDCCLVDENNRKYRNTGGGYADGYNTSKWAAEIFLSRLKLFVADLFISVYRPTLLLSHSDSEIEGEVNVTDWLSRVTIAIIETKTAPPLRLTVNYLPALPVDIASKSIIAIVCDEIITNEPSKINVYHVVNPHCENDAVGIDKIIDWIMTFPECYDVVRPPQNTQHSDWFKNQFMLRFDELSKNTQRKISSAIVGLIENPTSTHSTGLVVGSNFLRATLKSLGLKMIDIDSVFPHFNERSIHTTISHLVHKKVILLPSY